MRMTTKTDIEHLFRSNYRALLRLAVQMVHDESAAHDIVHDVFASLLTEGYAVASEGYLVRAVRNRCLNYLRNLSTRQRIAGLFALENETADSNETAPDISDRLASIVRGALSEQTRRVLTARFVDGLRYSEISAALGISEAAVYKHLRHAIDVLRKNLPDYE